MYLLRWQDSCPQEISTLEEEGRYGLVPLWRPCASEGGFHKRPSSPGVGICTCREQGGHHLQTRQLQERENISCHSICITGLLYTGSLPRKDGLKYLWVYSFLNDEGIYSQKAGALRMLSPASWARFLATSTWMVKILPTCVKWNLYLITLKLWLQS